MAVIAITLIGDDQAGLVSAVSEIVARHGGNWDRSHLAELAGKFAGIVQVTAPDASVDPMIAELESLEAQGLLAITAERAGSTVATDDAATTHVALELTGQDHPGIVHEISQILAKSNVSIDELETAIAPAPQGGNLFIASAILELPAGLTIEQVRDALETVAHDLMVDVALVAP